MTTTKKILYLLSAISLITAQGAFALNPLLDARGVHNKYTPTVSSVSSTSAVLSISPSTLTTLTEEDRQRVYFEYGETNQVCIMIYPTPEYCLPKKTQPGVTVATITNLKPNTSYTVTYKTDNTIRCITTPCPENGYTSSSVEFVTTSSDGGVPTTPVTITPITSNLGYKSRGAQVVALQKFLISQGYMTGTPTPYFGVLTLKAVKEFQRDHDIITTGFVGPLTRALLSKLMSSPVADSTAEMFEGKVTAYSTSCFADGECSITVDGKKVVTTVGWSQATVGKVLGIPDFGSIEQNIGAHAKVYAKKTSDGYTLYGSTDYYILITPAQQGKLPAGSTPYTNGAALKGTTWEWQKFVANDNVTTTPKSTGVFTVTFAADGTISGKTDCNGFFGSYTVGSDGVISFGPLGSTMMFCENSQESVFSGAVQKAIRYEVDASGNLILSLSDNGGKLYLVKK